MHVLNVPSIYNLIYTKVNFGPTVGQLVVVLEKDPKKSLSVDT